MRKKNQEKTEQKRNPYLDIQIRNEVLQVESFLTFCKLAARKDDGTVDETEQKMLKQIEKSADRFIRTLKDLAPEK